MTPSSNSAECLLTLIGRLGSFPFSDPLEGPKALIWRTEPRCSSPVQIKRPEVGCAGVFGAGALDAGVTAGGGGATTVSVRRDDTAPCTPNWLAEVKLQ